MSNKRPQQQVSGSSFNFHVLEIGLYSNVDLLVLLLNTNVNIDSCCMAHYRGRMHLEVIFVDFFPQCMEILQLAWGDHKVCQIFKSCIYIERKGHEPLKTGFIQREKTLEIIFQRVFSKHFRDQGK